MAVLALVVVVGGLGIGGLRLRRQASAARGDQLGQRRPGGTRRSAKADLAKVFGPGIDLVADDPSEALDLLTEAYGPARRRRRRERRRRASSTRCARRPWPASTGCTASCPVGSTDLFTFEPGEGKDPIDLTAMVRGPDGVPYVLDALDRDRLPGRTSSDKQGRPSCVKTGHEESATGPSPTPRFLAAGGRDLLILDAKNNLWRWRPADDEGKGTLTKVNVQGSAVAGRRRASGSARSCGPGTQGLYNLYVVDPSEQQIRPTRRPPTGRLPGRIEPAGWPSPATCRR